MATMTRNLPKKISINNIDSPSSIEMKVSDVPIGHVFKCHDFWPIYLKTKFEPIPIGQEASYDNADFANNEYILRRDSYVPKDDETVDWISEHRFCVIF